jgi:Outer membrane protein beta-barrel domain
MRLTSTLILLALLFHPAPAAAQGSGHTSGFLFGGTGGIDPGDRLTFWTGQTWSMGGGLDRRFGSGFLLQGEIELLQRPKSPGDQTAFLPSVNVGFASGHDRVAPFVSGGYTFAGNSAAFNIGGGVNIGVHEHVALRAEVRNFHMIFDVPLNVYEVRFGITFR